MELELLNIWEMAQDVLPPPLRSSDNRPGLAPAGGNCQEKIGGKVGKSRNTETLFLECFMDNLGGALPLKN